MKRDEMKIPAEAMAERPKPALCPVREGMQHYYNRDPLALEKLLQTLKDGQK